MSARGALMGNRGILHDAERRVTKPWAHNHWVACVLSFQGRRQTLFAPGRYSQLFFLDEATSLAAGHRPCAHCQRDRHVAFRTAWQRANADRYTVRTIDDLDRALHAERAVRGGGKRTFEVRREELPDGAMFEQSGSAYLAWRGASLAWSFEGYSRTGSDATPRSVVTVLTPPSIVRVLREGFVPDVHRTAGR
ncbi:MAG: hypothetical protein IT374_28210 [Polyangiaceae bacterium]|nr:hypothetical protein [Polyangiaceae bacterium]